MIPSDRCHPSSTSQDLCIKIVGLGGAGSNALDRLMLDGLAGAELVAVNTDAQALAGSVAPVKVQLGCATTRGLGAGGDPEVGYAATAEAAGEIRAALEGAHLVILCVGLGGGTGSGGARLIAEFAREQGARVVVFATLPFTFEGRRRRVQAEEALAAVRRDAQITICFENDRMGDAVSPLAGVQDAFVAADQTISQSVRAITALARRRGLMHLGFDEIATILRGPGEAAPRCLFGHGEAEGDNRANDALARALKNPLMDKGRLLDDARNVLVNITGGPGMTLSEVEILMEALNRHVGDDTRIHFGVAVDPQMGEKMSVVILSALPAGAAAAEPVTLRQATPAASAPTSSVPAAPVAEPPAWEKEETHEPRIKYVDTDEAMAIPEPVLIPAEPEPERVAASTAAPAPTRKKTEAKQEQMLLDPVTRGRFERSEPTIVDGQDLDVPTFLRRNVKVK